MKHARVSEVFARPARGAGQMTVAAAIVEFIDAVGLYSFDGRGYAASVVLLGLVLSGLQALVENQMGKAVLRQLPPEKVPAVVDADAGRIPLGEALVIALVVVLLLVIFGVL